MAARFAALYAQKAYGHKKEMMKRLGQTRKALPGEINYPAIDRFTLAHYAWGVILGASRFPLWGALLFAVGWEIIERPLKRHAWRLFPHGTQDSVPNMVGDASAMMLGWATWRLLPPAPTERNTTRRS